jgi:hypothetical protein
MDGSLSRLEVGPAYDASGGRDALEQDRRLRDALGVRAELSDARRSILHRQERDALMVLAAEKDGTKGVSAAQAQEALMLRAELLELAILKQARALTSMDEDMQRESARLDDLAAAVGASAAGKREDPRHIDNLNARLEALELWVLRSAPH